MDVALARSLIRRQFPRYAACRIRPLGSGWDNVTMRFGPDLLVRFPRRAVAAPLIENEQRWLPELSTRLPIPVPVPLHAGHPTEEYPWPWSIARWIKGRSADLAPPHPDESSRLAGFLASLHQRAPPDAPVNAGRGVPLMLFDEPARRRALKAYGGVDPATVARANGLGRVVWHDAVGYGIGGPSATRRRRRGNPQAGSA